MNKINQIIDNLVDYSHTLFEIEYDNKLEIPALSILIKDNRYQLRHKIIINYNLIKEESISVIAHILSHEWGHHMFKHTFTDPTTLTTEQRTLVELEADTYALNFIKKYNYNKNNIIKYIKKNHIKDCNIFQQKLNLLNKRLLILTY